MDIKTSVIMLTLLLSTPALGSTTTDVNLGGLILSVSDSRTAQVFHIVDQLSQWDQYAHKQYVRWARKNLKLDQEDQQLLRKHAEMRRARGWGRGFEQAFLVDDPIDVAATKATRSQLLSQDEAATEKMILQHFMAKLSVLIQEGAVQIASFRKQLIAQAAKIKPLVQQLRHFAEVREPIKVPVFLVTNPEEGSGGGEANGGVLVIEIQTQPAPLTSLFHESMHFLLDPHRTEIKLAAESVGLSWQVLNEGIAYALGPGLTNKNQESDPLIDALVRNVAQGKTMTDNYTQFYMVATVIRPLLQSALDHGQTITMFLPRAVSKWRTAVPR